MTTSGTAPATSAPGVESPVTVVPSVEIVAVPARAWPPSVTVVAPGVGSNPVPVIVTGVPPATGPSWGPRVAIVGGSRYANRSPRVTGGNPGVVTTTSTGPTMPGGVFPVIALDPWNRGSTRAAPSKVTVVAPAKFWPTIVTGVPPAAGPAAGVTAVSSGARAAALLTSNVRPTGAPGLPASPSVGVIRNVAVAFPAMLAADCQTNVCRAGWPGFIGSCVARPMTGLADAQARNGPPGPVVENSATIAAGSAVVSKRVYSIVTAPPTMAPSAGDWIAACGASFPTRSDTAPAIPPALCGAIVKRTRVAAFMLSRSSL